MSKLKCTVCSYIYDEEEEGKFGGLGPDWLCPICRAMHALRIELPQSPRLQTESLPIQSLLE